MSRRAAVLAAAAAITAAICLYAIFAPRHLLTVTFLDVGDGLCGVVRAPSGRIMVYDCGTSSWRSPEKLGDRLVAPYLRSLGADRIDVAVLSHPHSDHLSGYPSLFRVVPPDLVLDCGRPHPSPGYADFLRSAKSSGARYRRAYAGQRFDLGDGVRVEVLSPMPASSLDDLNDSSLVLRISYGKSSFLLAGDAGEEVEMRLMSAGEDVRADVLQVAHHGSGSATSQRWLDAVQPRVAVISCARKSQYGHPDREVVERLQSRGSRVFVTANDGAVRIVSDGSTIRVRRFSAAR